MLPVVYRDTEFNAIRCVEDQHRIAKYLIDNHVIDENEPFDFHELFRDWRNVKDLFRLIDEPIWFTIKYSDTYIRLVDGLQRHLERLR